MLTQEQIIASNKMLKVLKSIDYSKTVTYWNILETEGYDYYSAVEIRKLLLDLKLIHRTGKSEYYVKLTPEGNIAEQFGVEKYLLDLEKEKQMLDRSLIATISNSKTAKWALLIGALTLLSMFLIPNYENIISSKKDSDTKSENRDTKSDNGNNIRSTDSTTLKDNKDSI